MKITNDPHADADAKDREHREFIERLPRCARCKHPIEQEDAVHIDGDYYCDECLDELRESIGDE